MRTNELLEIEKDNIDSIFLYKEGVFWRCYETSAWYFIKNIREYRVFKKFFKIVNQNIIYLGFPDSILEKITKSRKKRLFSY